MRRNWTAGCAKGRRRALAQPERRWLARAAWALVLVVTVVAIAVGASGRGRPQSLYQRTMAVAGQYKCPVCQGESVAASSAPEAVEIRDLIGKWLAEGRTEQQVRAHLVADYGQSILEKPPASGIGVLLWVLPAALVLLAVLGLAGAFWRWHLVIGGRAPLRAVALPGPVAGPAVTGSPGGQAGGGREGAPAAPPQAAPVAAGAPGRRSSARAQVRATGWRQRATLASGLALVVVAGALWYADRSSGPRQPGGTVSGGPGPASTSEQLRQAAALSAKDPSAALVIYSQVLASDPAQPTALTEEAWIYAEAGYKARAMTLLGQVERLHPDFDLAHLYRGLVLLDYERDPRAAAGEIRWYLSHGPSPSLVGLARQGLALAEHSSGKGKGKGKG